jgi:glycosyltransferase involved in cell wall biosynthesis
LSLVSVIVPCYDSAAYIGQTLESIFAQSYRPIEVIVIDDGSKDNTASIVRQYSSSLRYYRQSNQGVSMARNAGIRLAQGEYLAFIDSDDLWQMTKLEVQVDVLDKHPEVVLVYCLCSNFTDDISGERSSILSLPSGLITEKLILDNFVPCSTVVVRRSSIEDVGEFDASLRTCEDWDMWLRLSERGYFYGIPRTLAYHRCRKGSLSFDLESLRKDGIFVLERYFRSLSLNDSLQSLKWSALQRNEVKIGMTYVSRGQVWKGLAGLLRGIYFKPYDLSCRFPIKSMIKSFIHNSV